MSAPWVIGLVLYGIVALVVCRAVAGALAYEFSRSPGMDDWVMGTLAGMVAGWLWPLILPVLAVKHMPPVLVIGGERRLREREKADEAQRRESRLVELERRNAQLERELGI